MMYYVNDGVYGSFNCLLFDHAKVEVSTLQVVTTADRKDDLSLQFTVSDNTRTFTCIYVHFLLHIVHFIKDITTIKDKCVEYAEQKL